MEKLVEELFGEEEAKVWVKKLSPGTKQKIKKRVEEIPPDLLPISVETFNDIVSKTDLIYIPQARKYDVRVDDVSEADLGDIGELLGNQRLQACERPMPFPFHGCIYGSSAARMFVSLPVKPSEHGAELVVNFLYDTASPHSFLRRDTFCALFPLLNSPRRVGMVWVHDICIWVSESHGHFENVDLLGQDFFVRGQLTVETDYRSNVFAIRRS